MHALRWVSEHTGLPVVVVAAIAIAISFRIFRRFARLAIEIAVVSAILLVATRLGWITW